MKKLNVLIFCLWATLFSQPAFAQVKYSIVDWTKTHCYIFKGTQCFKYNLNVDAVESGYPKSIQQEFPGIGFDQIDAVINWDDGYFYFFKANQYIRYNMAQKKAEGNVRFIKEGWPNLPPLFHSNIDAAVHWGNKVAYFFKGSQYLKYDMRQDKVSPATPPYPRQTLANWNKLTFTKIDGIINMQNGRAFIFSGDKYVRWDVNNDQAMVETNYPRRIDDGWKGLIPSLTSLENEFRKVLQSMNLATIMKSAVDKNFTDLVNNSEPQKLQALTDKIRASKVGEWCGYTSFRCLGATNMNSTLERFFDGTIGINCFANYKNDGNEKLQFKVGESGMKMDLESFQQSLGIARMSFSVADVLSGKVTPQAGDIILLDNGASPYPDHIQMVLQYNINNKNLIIIEGNASSFVKRKSAPIQKDNNIPKLKKNDGLSRFDRLVIVRQELGDLGSNGVFEWNDPTEGGNTHVGVSAYNLNEHQKKPRDAAAPLKIVSFIRPSIMDFIPTVMGQKIYYQGPYHTMKSF